MPKDDMMTRGRRGGVITLKSDDVIYEQPLMVNSDFRVLLWLAWFGGKVKVCRHVHERGKRDLRDSKERGDTRDRRDRKERKDRFKKGETM